MRVLNLSLDKAILEKDSAVQKRLIALAEKAGEITVFVSGEWDEKKEISPHLTAHSFGGPKVIQIWKMWREGNKILNPSPDSEVGVLPFGKGELRPYDLITVQDVYFLGLLGHWLAKKFTVPLEVQVHGFEKMRGVRERLARFVLRRADKIRVVSERLKREIDLRFPSTRAKLGTGRSKIKDLSKKMYELPVYTQIHPTSILLSKEGRRSNAPFTFLTVGRLVPVKNIGMQIRAFARLAKEAPHIRLRIVGDGPLRESLELQVASLKLEEKITFEGRQGSVSNYYEEADAFLLTSDSEGWGVVVTEAAAYGLPIIMTDVGLAGEFLINGENGLVIPVGDEGALVAAMKRIIEDANLRARLGAAARSAFCGLPTPEAQIQKQVEEWRSLR